MRVKLLQILLLCGLCLGSISGSINQIINKPNLSNVSFGIQVISADDGNIVYSHQANRLMIPASNMKIVTSAAAMDIIGSDYEFTTAVYNIDGNLIIKGSGDPLTGDQTTLQSKGFDFGWELKKIVNALKDAKIDSINDIIVDSSVFDDELTHPSWPREQLNRAYAPEVSGINYNGNCIDIVAFPSNSSVGFTKHPNTGYVNIINRASINSERTNTIWVSRPPNSNNLTLMGRAFQRTAPVQVTIHRPAVYFGYILAENLAAEGISLKGSIIETHKPLPDVAAPITQFTTSLEEVMIRCNRDSFNLAAECLAKKISAVRTKGKIGGQWQHSGEVIEAYLASIGIDTSEFVFDDGSGLSRENRLTANLLTSLLLYIYNGEQRQFYIDTLAIGGVEGSGPVRRHFTEPEYRGRIFAKSGTIRAVQAMSGYCFTDNGNYIFSIIINNSNSHTRDALNDIIKAIFDN